MKTPSTLRNKGKEFWKKVLSEYELEESHDLQRLELACRCLDDISEAEKQIESDGTFVKDRYGQLKEHPAGKIIRDNRIIFCRIIRELGLDLTTGPETRPPRRY